MHHGLSFICTLHEMGVVGDQHVTRGKETNNPRTVFNSTQETGEHKLRNRLCLGYCPQSGIYRNLDT